MGDVLACTAYAGHMAHESTVFSTDLRLAGRRQGKVRDVYEMPPGQGGPGPLLIVASDRISAFDVVMPTPIPGKGRLLTRMSRFWFQFVEQRRVCPTHVLSFDASEVPDAAFAGATTTRADLVDRVTIGKRCRVIPIECVVRGYVEGSGWKDYQRTGSICGVSLPPGLKQCQRLPEPIFTPATKEEQGVHDENVTFDEAARRVGRDVMETLRRFSLAIYTQAAAHALSRGIIIADTKFEFGFELDARGQAMVDRGPILIDEILTPDSSRFWPVAGYEPGRAQRSFDKQFLREYLESLVASGSWNKQAPGPALPLEVAEATRAKYDEAARLLTNS
ncbi:MAG: phosphoribosylaminoimidazolesuccinocarboxamide synthase [Planctomycetota bacterium]|nr:phosphoribosylaminoimidazolesuccinocarboxamide synthase [Planctomycetota bacterium]